MAGRLGPGQGASGQQVRDRGSRGPVEAPAARQPRRIGEEGRGPCAGGPHRVQERPRTPANGLHQRLLLLLPCPRRQRLECRCQGEEGRLALKAHGRPGGGQQAQHVYGGQLQGHGRRRHQHLEQGG